MVIGHCSQKKHRFSLGLLLEFIFIQVKQTHDIIKSILIKYTLRYHDGGVEFNRGVIGHVNGYCAVIFHTIITFPPAISLVSLY